MYNNVYAKTVGYDRMLKNVSSLMDVAASKYPPYNIIKTDDYRYKLELAVAGLDKDDIVVKTEDGRLYISYDTKYDDREYLHKGISQRHFDVSMKLADTVVVEGAYMSSGLLVIDLHNQIPEEKKPQVIKIEDQCSTTSLNTSDNNTNENKHLES